MKINFSKFSSQLLSHSNCMPSILLTSKFQYNYLRTCNLAFQGCIQNPVKHLAWNVMQILLVDEMKIISYNYYIHYNTLQYVTKIMKVIFFLKEMLVT